MHDQHCQVRLSDRLRHSTDQQMEAYLGPPRALVGNSSLNTLNWDSRTEEGNELQSRPTIPQLIGQRLSGEFP